MPNRNIIVHDNAEEPLTLDALSQGVSDGASGDPKRGLQVQDPAQTIITPSGP